MFDEDAETGGGGSGTGIASLFDKDAAIKLTGSTASEETVADQDRRFSAARTRIDTSVSVSHYETNDPPGTPTHQEIENCRGTTCTVTNQNGDSPETDEFDPSEYADFIAGQQKAAVLTKNGITLIERRGFEDDSPNARVYGAWMDHGGFLVGTKFQATRQIDGENTLVTFRVAEAGGDATGTRPSSNATWAGVMVGTPTRGDHRDNILQGDARLTYTSSDTEIGAAFTNIVDLDRKASHSVSEVSFDDVSVGTEGNYAQGTAAGNFIRGEFFGSGHAETGGVFEKDGIIGAFGAKK